MVRPALASLDSTAASPAASRPAAPRWAAPCPRWTGLLLTALCLAASRASAQSSALDPPESGSRIRYARNESGGSISWQSPALDGEAVEAIRLQLLEAAAAIRRGDLRLVRLVRPDSPAARVVAENRDRIRCTYRVLPRGGELVLLSDDSRVVAAIHAVLATTPPALER